MSDTQLPGRLFQIGMVVPDLQIALTGLTGTLGAQRFMTLPENPKRAWFRGGMLEMSYRLAFGYIGDMQIELIQPVSGPSTYAEFLARVPTGGVHHWGFEVDDFDSAGAEMEHRGYRAVQKGNFGATRFAYFENGHDPGVITEILYLDEAAKLMFESIRNQTFAA